MNEMTCAAIRDTMLEAELDELRGLGESDLAQHVRSCADCRQRAELLLQNYAKLSAALDSMQPRGPQTRVVPLPRNRRTLYWVPIPLAAAAVIALLMIPRLNDDDQLPRIDLIAKLMFQRTPVASPPPGRQAMVIEKDDMTIVWLYGQETP